MSTRAFVLLVLLLPFLNACLEEPILPKESLYSDNIIEEFSVFDPCDTIQTPAYRLTRALNVGTEISRLFHLQQPSSDLVLLGRAATNTTFQNKRELFFHGLTIADQQSAEPVFILSEDKVGLGSLAADNIYLIGQAGSFENRYLFLSSSDALASAAVGRGDVFKVRLYELEEAQDTLTVKHKLQLNATASGASITIFEFASSPLPDKEEIQVIQDAITKMRSGSFSFDPANQVKKIDLQLALYQRDFRFAEGLFKKPSFLNLLSDESQQTISVLNRVIEQKAITAFFCLSDQETWAVSNNLAPGIPTPLD
jgi:hypothetical protein